MMRSTINPNLQASYSTLERDDDDGQDKVCYLYKHGDVWKIGQNYNSARALLFTGESNFSKIANSDWFEVLRGTKNSKKVNTVNIVIKEHSFKSDIGLY